MSSTRSSIQLKRMFTEAGVHPFDTVEWDVRTAEVGTKFRQDDVEVPKAWSQNATNIVAQKYFRGTQGSPERESSARQIFTRVANTITQWGKLHGYFNEDDSRIFYDELLHILVHQMAAFNSPVWFNVGWMDEPQCSACFLLAVEDTMDSMLNWNTEEGMIFKGGSGAGVNLSVVRGSMEGLSKGGIASGPVSFMRGADSWAGSIASGGSTRRAAKMVVLEIDHPDIQAFIKCKAVEEDKIAALKAAGFDMTFDSEVFNSVQYQNANNSVRVSDKFMQAVVNDEDWDLTARVDGRIIQTVKARELWSLIAECAWRCGDPGVQFEDTIQAWHTLPKVGRITTSNPCSEYLSVDNSACNLASLNMTKFIRHNDLNGEPYFLTEEFMHVVDVIFLAQEIIVTGSSYPTEKISRTAEDFRQLGLGYTNFGSMLMEIGVPYASRRGRHIARGVTALMNARAAAQSACIAAVKGPYKDWQKHSKDHLRVVRAHWDDLKKSNWEQSGHDLANHLTDVASRQYEEAISLAMANGFRNAQFTLLAPTGTISFLMDCGTTGIEPDFALVKTKNLVGGGTMQMVNPSVPLALKSLKYDDANIERICRLLLEGTPIHKLVDGAHVPVFATATGDNSLLPSDHLEMMAAAQKHLSGAISKTVNLPNEATPQDMADAYFKAWKLELKAVALYRDGCKSVQAYETTKSPAGDPKPVRRKLPKTRQSVTHKFNVGGHEGYITAGKYDDGTLGEIFMTDIGKEGSTLRGMTNAFATTFSLALQYGVPLQTLVEKFSHMKFDPAGVTGNPQIPTAKSIVDYTSRWLASQFLPEELHEEFGILDLDAKLDTNLKPSPVPKADGTLCGECGGTMRRTGTCYTCQDCGFNTGCG